MSVIQDNLWESLTEQARLDGTLDANLSVKQIMDSWTLQKGYPLLRVDRVENQLRITQNVMLFDRTTYERAHGHQSKWFIGFTYTTKQQLNWDIETRPIWFRPDQSECKTLGVYFFNQSRYNGLNKKSNFKVIVDLPTDTRNDSWLLGNIRHSGWFRINYDEKNWRLLIDQLNTNHTCIHPTHRAQLLDDSFILTLSGHVNATLFLDISRYLVNETEIGSFFMAIKGIDVLSFIIQDNPEANELFEVCENKT